MSSSDPNATGKAAAADDADLYEEFQRSPQPGEKPKPKGLNAAGYRFPPDGPVAMTKENLARGVAGAPTKPEPAPPTELKDANAMFETYERPDLRDKPRTGTGLRGPPPRTAKEILADYKPPEPQVFVPRRERVAEPSGVEHDAAHLDAEADLAAMRGATMSSPRSHGPIRTVTQDDPLRDMPQLPGIRRAASAPGAGGPHASGAPALALGAAPRIAIVQADFHYELTSRMAEEAKAEAVKHGATVTHHVHVPGVYDIPLLAKVLARREDVEAVVVVGCVLQGQTGHDELIARECARKLADLAYDSEKPVGLGVTGPRMSLEAAEARVPTTRYAVESVIKQWRALKALGAARIVGS